VAQGINRVTTGLSGLDGLLQGLIPGDNIVWIAEGDGVLTVFEDAYLHCAVEDGRSCSYVTSVVSPPELRRRLGPEVAIIDARRGRPLDDPVLLERAMVERGRLSPLEVTVVDSLNTFAARWGQQKALAFFSRTCPQLFNFGALAYWRASRLLLGESFLESVRGITQCVMEVVGDQLRVVKAEGRPRHLQGQVVRFRLVDGVMEVKPEWALSRLGRGLEGLRKARNLTQASLARIAEVTPSAISQAESGHRGLSLDTLLIISDKLSVSVDDILSSPTPGYMVVRHDHLGGGEPMTVLLDDPSTGLRAVLVRLGPGEDGGPPWRHKGTELVLVGSGLLQLHVGQDSPVVRAGDAVLATSAHIDGWKNLLSDPARLFWITRDP